MLKQYAKVEWTQESKKDFEEIKRVVVDALVLVSLDYLKLFYIYSFASDHSCPNMLMQKDEVSEHTIAFMSATLKDVELCYHNVEKQVYALVYGVNNFWHYILRNKVFTIVPDPNVKTLLMQNELGERREKWVTLQQEYDMEIHPMKLIWGKSLTHKIVEIELKLMVQQYHYEDVSPDEYYDDIIYYLLNNKFPPRLQGVQKWALKLRSKN